MIQDPTDLDNIQIRTSSGRMVPLASLVTFKETAVAPSSAARTSAAPCR